MRRQEDLRQVLAIPFELMRAASGHPITVTTLDGEEVCLRIPTVGEMTVLLQRAHAAVPEGPPFPPLAEIERLVAPLPI